MRSKQSVPGDRELASQPTDVPTLPVWKAFVVQFSRETGAQPGTFSGRVEHISSGCSERFTSPGELLATLGKMLEQLGETRA